MSGCDVVGGLLAATAFSDVDDRRRRAGGRRHRGGGLVGASGDSGERHAQFGTGCEAIHRPPSEQSVDEFGKAVRQRRPKAGKVGGVAIEPCQGGVGVGLAEKRNPSGEALVEDQSERVEVGAAVELLAAHLLG